MCLKDLNAKRNADLSMKALAGVKTRREILCFLPALFRGRFVVKDNEQFIVCSGFVLNC